MFGLGFRVQVTLSGVWGIAGNTILFLGQILFYFRVTLSGVWGIAIIRVVDVQFRFDSLRVIGL